MKSIMNIIFIVTLLILTTIYIAQAKTTDELINDVENLLNKAPDAKKKEAVVAAAVAIKPSALPAKMPMATPMVPQSAAVAGGNMRFQQTPPQQQGGVPNSPFGGSAYAALQGSQMLNNVMNMGGATQQQQQQNMPSPQQQELQMMQQQHMLAQQQMQQQQQQQNMPRANMNMDSRRSSWQPPPSKETNLNIPSSGIPAPTSLIQMKSKVGNDVRGLNQHAWSPEATVNSLYKINKNKIARNLPQHLDQEIVPEQQPAMDLLETASKVHAKSHSHLRHHLRHHMKHHMKHHMRHHAKQRHHMQVQNEAAKIEAEAYMNANVFGYGRAKEVGSSFGIRSFGERTNPAPVRATPKTGRRVGSPGQYNKVNEIAKAEAWERSQKAKNIVANAAAPAPQQQQQKMTAPLQPRFREIFPQQANDVSPFYKAHMVGNKNNDINALHSSLNDLDKIPDVSSNSNSRVNTDNKDSRFAENLVQNLDLSKNAEKTEQAAATNEQAHTSSQSHVSKPEYENTKANAKNRATASRSSATTPRELADKATVPAVQAPRHVATHVRPHSRYHKKPTALMRFNSIKAGHFKPTASRIVWHSWVSKSKDRVKQRIKSAILNYAP